MTSQTMNLAIFCGAIFALMPTSHAIAQRDVQFEKITLTKNYYCDGVHFGDFNHDGQRDVVAGPFWYQGPDFKQRHKFYPAVALKPEASPSDSMFSFAYDFNGDGWDDILTLGRVHKHAAFWRENPRGKPGTWKKHFAFPFVRGESPQLVDIDGDGQSELIAHWENRWGWISPDPKTPAKPWTFFPISKQGDYNQFYHGEGMGDINGDGRQDLVINDGWFEQPSDKTLVPWPFHATKFGEKGGSQIYVYDVDHDGDNDVISALNGHGWGLAWFEQIDDSKPAKFRRHMIMGDRSAEEKYGVAFSQVHAIALADINGDGLQDIVTGKRRWAHGPQGDVEPNQAAVVYWFQLSRENGQVKYTPHKIDDDSGTGVQINATDVNGDGTTDVLTVSKLGTFLFLQKKGSSRKSGS